MSTRSGVQSCERLLHRKLKLQKSKLTNWEIQLCEAGFRLYSWLKMVSFGFQFGCTLVSHCQLQMVSDWLETLSWLTTVSVWCQIGFRHSDADCLSEDGFILGKTDLTTVSDWFEIFGLAFRTSLRLKHTTLLSTFLHGQST